MKINQNPVSLPVFFSTELWERYGFYVIQTLLTLYMVMHFHWPDTKVYALVGSFTALTYLSPFIGGWIADSFIGQKNAVLLGAIILFVSYIFLGFSHHIPSLIKALASIAIGTGLLKPNISSLLGNQYSENDPHRENGYTIFYLGITTGIILGTTLPSLIKHYFGWQMAFLSAALGMILSIASFSTGIIRYNIQDYNPKTIDFKNMAFTSLVLILTWPLFGYILLHTEFANIVFPIISILSLVYMLYSYTQEHKPQSQKILAILCLCIISVLFWAFYFQMFMAFVLFITRLVNNKLWGILFPPPYYVAIESIGMIIIGWIITRIQPKEKSLNLQATQIVNKFVLSMVCIAAAYLLILLVCLFHPAYLPISPLFLIPAYLILSLAELMLSPVGISAVAILAPRNKVSTLMGVFFVSLGLGGYLSGKLAVLTAIPNTVTDASAIKALYMLGFSKLFIILIILVFFSLILRKIFIHLMRDC